MGLILPDQVRETSEITDTAGKKTFASGEYTQNETAMAKDPRHA
jgi:hypothetical protein